MTDPNAILLNLRPVGKSSDKIAVLTINRPESANAFNSEMLEMFLSHFQVLSSQPGIRALILRGAGKHFSAGADLGWMREAGRMSFNENRKEAERLGHLYEVLQNLPFPTLAVVQGSAFGGALGLISACDWAIATEEARFCLSEVRVGLVAAVILPYVSQRIQKGWLHRFVLTGVPFNSEDALRSGLVQRVVPKEKLNEAIREEIGWVLQGSTEAQSRFKKVHLTLLHKEWKEWEDVEKWMQETISELRMSKHGQEGLAAFLEKRKPSWTVQLDENWTIE